MKNRWRTDEEVMKNWWRTDAELMKNWWRTDEKLMKNRWRTNEELMKSWWRTDEELMKNWWRTDEELLKTTTDYHRLPLTATDWLVLLHWTLKPISGMYTPSIYPWLHLLQDNKSTASGANKWCGWDIEVQSGKIGDLKEKEGEREVTEGGKVPLHWEPLVFGWLKPKGHLKGSEGFLGPV